MMNNDPRRQALRQFLDAIQPGLSDRPEDLPKLDMGSATGILSHLLELACRSQHVGNIDLARRYLLAIPRDWLTTSIAPLAEALIASGGEWEYRRLLELYENLDNNLLLRLTDQGLSSDNREIREAADDFRKRRYDRKRI